MRAHTSRCRRAIAFVASVAAALAFPAGAAALSFDLTRQPTGETPVNVAVGDLNKDGRLDLATANLYTRDVTVLLGNGSGGFVAAPGSPFEGGDNPRSVAIGDLNRDRKPDLAVAGGSSVRVLLGSGSGSFVPAPGSPFAAGELARSVAIRDLNDDGKRDLAVTDYFGPSGWSNVWVLRGDGSGGFVPEPHSPYRVGKNPNSIAVADLNKDGRPDLATANSGSDDVTVLLRNRAGGFVAAPQSPLRVGNHPLAVATGNLNNDGKPDLAVASDRAHNVSVLLGNGSGRFVRPSGGGRFTVGYTPYSVAIGDFNSDGKPDLAVPDVSAENVWVLLGDGSGHFVASAGSPFWIGGFRQGPASVAIADFNADGRPDLTTANGYQDTASVLLNTSASTATPTPSRLSFGSQRVGTRSSRRSVVIANTGQARLHVSKVGVGGRNSDDFKIPDEDCTGRSILVGRRCRVHLRFAPRARGARAAVLQVFSNDPRGPLAIRISGTGTAPG